VARFRDHLAELGIGLDVDTALGQGAAAPLASPVELMGRRVGNRFCVHPMEGWDADADGRPTRQSRRRWQALGRSGAKMLWNESIAMNPSGRSSPEQLLIAAHTVESLAAIRREQVAAHVELHGRADDLLVGIQLTHAGRHSKPGGRSRPVAVRRHPMFGTRSTWSASDACIAPRRTRSQPCSPAADPTSTPATSKTSGKTTINLLN
jgi:2,4-dienoyl-CoA reductase-like NADH-dependent reductase (Old Yellow Enzyme family)